MPGKAFELLFEMPEADVGIMTFNNAASPRSVGGASDGPTSWRRTATRPVRSRMIETTKMYNPNMKVEILAIPPRRDPDDVCCKWRFSMRAEDDPEYVPVELTTKRDDLQS